MGKLFVVSTPIGNLEDITLRALSTLNDVDLILSEDTRETDKIFRKFDIKTPQISYRDQNHDRVITKIKLSLDEGSNLALVSDSGTPAISDPGFRLVKDLVDSGYKVESIPGPSAIIAALSVSGLPTDKFCFLGFLPKSEKQREELLVTYGSLDATLVLYESPFRVKKLLTQLYHVLGNRKVCLAKDLTKLYEDITTQNLAYFSENLDKIVEKGEYVVLIAKKDY